jgi:hypothetical protein
MVSAAGMRGILRRARVHMTAANHGRACDAVRSLMNVRSLAAEVPRGVEGRARRGRRDSDFA